MISTETEERFRNMVANKKQLRASRETLSLSRPF